MLTTLGLLKAVFRSDGYKVYGVCLKEDVKKSVPERNVLNEYWEAERKFYCMHLLECLQST